MAGNKKKKKPASNPARGFATTSIASKPKVDQEPIKDNDTQETSSTAATSELENLPATNGSIHDTPGQKKELSPEEFEKHLEENELQQLVDKHAQKSKRDATRQKTRLETERRVLRSQAETLGTRRWLSPDLLDEILDLIHSEGRPSSQGTEGSSKQIPEEDLVIRLWTLRQALVGAGFPEDKVGLGLREILEQADRISGNSKDVIWGLEESLEWLARECSREELPGYDNRGVSKSQQETPRDSPLPSGATTPLPEPDTRHTGGVYASAQATPNALRPTPRKKVLIDNDSDIDPDELLPVYLETRAKLFDRETSVMHSKSNSTSNNGKKPSRPNVSDPEIQKLQRKLKKIESDVLFDRYLADQAWEPKRIELEKKAAAERQAAQQKAVAKQSSGTSDSEDEVMKEAAKMTAELLEAEESDDDAALADLFASLPMNEVDPATGKTNTVVNGTNGVKIIIRDFGKWTGLSPQRILEEICRSKDSNVKLTYTSLSESTYAERHALKILWAKTQELSDLEVPFGIEYQASKRQLSFAMRSIAAPDAKQSEGYIATIALFMVSSSSSKDDKAALRLPATWRDLYNELAEQRKDKLDAEDRAAIRVFRDMVRTKRDQELEDGVINQNAFRNRGAGRATDVGETGQNGVGQSMQPTEFYQRIWHDKSSTATYQTMLQSRMNLPMWGFKDELLAAIDRQQVVIVCGETGCGKSTQVPSYILEHELSKGKPCKIYCTEPRRISAISLARRVSEELGERRNDLGSSRSLVGYAIRLESNTSKENRLVFATTGIVMRMLEASNDLRDITHIVLDEVHERTIDSDFLLIVLRKLMVKRPDLKVILMSATVDAERFSKYLDGCQVLNVPGRTFPVATKYLEDAIELTGYTLDNTLHEANEADEEDMDLIDQQDNLAAKAENVKTLRGYSAKTRNTIAQMDEYRIEYELVVQLLVKIATDHSLQPFSRAVLVFLPGIGEIRQLNDLLVGHPVLSRDWFVYPLHSTIASEDQEAAFLVPPPGTRKIVLATNIAETGITIPDITCVIDTCKHREMRFDERRQLSRLLETFISKANAKQRRGRAGRVQEGLAFHLVTKYRHDSLMAEQQTPEFLRLSLQDLAIRVKICKLGGIEETLGQALDPPSAKNTRRAIDALIDVRALTAGEDLTPLGVQLARLPLDVFLGKLILLGSIFKCLDAAITIAAILSSKSPFVTPFGARAQADTVRLGYRRGDSDLLTIYNAYLAWKKACLTGGSDYQFCKKNFLSSQTLSNIEDLKGQLVVGIVDAGFLQLTTEERSLLNKTRFSNRRRTFFEMPQRANANSDNDTITSSVVAWSFYPKLLIKDGKGYRNVGNNQSISLHPTSVNKGHQELKWLSYYHIMQAKQFYNAHETTAVEEFAIALLCGDVRCDMYAGVFILDGNRARFAVSDWKTMLVVKTLRAKLREIMNKSFKTPGKALTLQQQKWMEVWQKIFTQEWKDKQSVMR